MLVISVKSTLKLISLNIFVSILSAFGLGSLKIEKTAIIIKIIVNYTQIIAIYFTFRL